MISAQEEIRRYNKYAEENNRSLPCKFAYYSFFKGKQSPLGFHKIAENKDYRYTMEDVEGDLAIQSNDIRELDRMTTELKKVEKEYCESEEYKALCDFFIPLGFESACTYTPCTKQVYWLNLPANIRRGDFKKNLVSLNLRYIKMIEESGKDSDLAKSKKIGYDIYLKADKKYSELQLDKMYIKYFSFWEHMIKMTKVYLDRDEWTRQH